MMSETDADPNRPNPLKPCVRCGEPTREITRFGEHFVGSDFTVYEPAPMCSKCKSSEPSREPPTS